MNKGLLSVDEALETLLAGARPVAEIEQVPTMEAVVVSSRVRRLRPWTCRRWTTAPWMGMPFACQI